MARIAVICAFRIAVALLLPASILAAGNPVADLAYERGARALRDGHVEAALEALAEAERLAPNDSATLALHARALLIAGRVPEAFEKLERLESVDPDSSDLRYFRGLARYRAEDWRGAREDLGAELEVRPQGDDAAVLHLLLGVAAQELGDLPEAERQLLLARELDASLRRARNLAPTLEAQVAYRLGLIAMERREIDAARTHFEQVERLLPRSKLARSAGRHLTRLARQAPGDLELWATIGGAYDSNVGLAADDDVFGLRGGEGGALAIADLGGSYQLFETKDYGLRVGQRGWLSFHEDETDFDLQVNQTWATATASLNEWATAELTYLFEYIWLDWDGYRLTHAVEPALEFHLRGDFLTRAFFRHEDRTSFVDEDPEFDRDGRVLISGLDLQYVMPEVVPWARAWMRVGYRYRLEDTSGGQYDADGHGAVATLGLWLPAKILLTLDGDYEWRQYESASLLAPSKGRRFDRIRSFEAAISRAFSRRVNLELGYLYTNRGSNVGAYAYRRNRFQMLATYRY